MHGLCICCYCEEGVLDDDDVQRLFFVQVLVVANPANTNALILKEFAPSIPEKNISCLTRLDHNRALGQISERLNVQVSDVKNVIIWGNHSSSQYPDVNHATVTTPAGDKPARELVADDEWCRHLSLPGELLLLLLAHPLNSFPTVAGSMEASSRLFSSGGLPSSKRGSSPARCPPRALPAITYVIGSSGLQRFLLLSLKPWVLATS